MSVFASVIAYIFVKKILIIKDLALKMLGFRSAMCRLVFGAENLPFEKPLTKKTSFGEAFLVAK